MKLTPCQLNAEKEFQRFLLREDQQFIVLDGAPGVGKTTLINHFKESLPKYNLALKVIDAEEIKNIVTTATTNKAASLLDSCTIYSALGFVLLDDYKTGDSYLQATGKGTVVPSDILVIDEASMLSEKTLEEILPYLPNKVIFSLDRYQLPPVGCNYIPLADGRYPIVSLVTPVRFDVNSHIYKFTQHLRECIDLNKMPELGLGGDMLFLSSDEAQNAIRYHVTKDMQPEDFKILCFTNKAVEFYNSYAREYLGYSKEFQEGDIVTVNSSVQVLNKAKAPRLINQKSYKLSSVNLKSRVFYPDNIDSELSAFTVEGNNYTYWFDSFYNHKNTIKKLKSKDIPALIRYKHTTTYLTGAYASTVHKSQGSTYNYALIDLTDLSIALKSGTKESLDLFLRLLLVATSRARKGVYMHGSL